MMKKEKEYPLISVIVPTFERSELLPRALDSIVAQTWTNTEIIVVDDNIPDSIWQKKTREVLVPYLKNNNLIYMATAGEVGGGAARNLALKKCHGDYIAFLDDDDRYLPEKLEKQLHFMQEHDLDVCYQDVKWVDSNEKLVELRKMDYATDFTVDGLLKTHILHPIAPTAIYMCRREKLLETEGFGEVCTGQDYILMLRCIEKGLKIGYMPGAYVIQYLHEGKRVSLGDNKVRGENNLYRLKQQYFQLLSRRERTYVRFRHYAVLSFASLRSHRLFRAAGYAVVTVLSSPLDCVREAGRYFGGR